MKQRHDPLVREFSALMPYQSAYTLICSLEPEENGCWLCVCRRSAEGPEQRARAWAAAPEEACWKLLRFLYENSVQPELWEDAISYWYPQPEQQREGSASDEH